VCATTSDTAARKRGSRFIKERVDAQRVRARGRGRMRGEGVSAPPADLELRADDRVVDRRRLLGLRAVVEKVQLLEEHALLGRERRVEVQVVHHGLRRRARVHLPRRAHAARASQCSSTRRPDDQRRQAGRDISSDTRLRYGGIRRAAALTLLAVRGFEAAPGKKPVKKMMLGR
jgi:hypothetical protein